MTRKQRKLIEIWLALIALVGAFAFKRYNYAFSVGAQILVFVYFLANINSFSLLTVLNDSAGKRLLLNKRYQTACIIYTITIMAISSYYLLSGTSPEEHFGNVFLVLIGVFVAPFLAPLIISQIETYKDLGIENA